MEGTISKKDYIPDGWVDSGSLKRLEVGYGNGTTLYIPVISQLSGHYKYKIGEQVEITALDSRIYQFQVIDTFWGEREYLRDKDFVILSLCSRDLFKNDPGDIDQYSCLVFMRPLTNTGLNNLPTA